MNEVRHPPTSMRALLPLLVAGTLGRAPMVCLPIASLLLVAEHSTLTLSGFASGAVSLGAGSIGLLLGRRLEGSAAKAALIVATVLHVPAILLFLAFADSTRRPVLVAIGLFAGLTVAPMGPVVRALLAGQVADGTREDRKRVFAWDSLSVEISWIGAPLLVSLAVIIGGPTLAVAMSPLLAVISILPIVRRPIPHARIDAMAERWLNPTIVRLALAFGVAGFAWRAVTIGVTEIARHHGGDKWAGPAIALWAVGSAVGAWIATRYEMPPTLLLGVLVGAPIAFIAASTHSLPLTGLLVFVSGLPTAPFVAAINASVGDAVDSSAHARAFSLVQAASTIMAAAGAAATTWSIDNIGIAKIFIPAALALAVSGWLGDEFGPIRRSHRQPTPAAE